MDWSRGRSCGEGQPQALPINCAQHAPSSQALALPSKSRHCRPSSGSRRFTACSHFVLRGGWRGATMSGSSTVLGR